MSQSKDEPDIRKEMAERILSTHQIHSAAAVVLNSRGHFLAVSRKGRHTDLGFPAGKVERGESPEEAMRRELFEETGYIAHEARPLFLHTDGHGDRVCLAFLVTCKDGVLIGEPGTWVGWVPPELLCSEACTYREYNRAYFAYQGWLVV